MANLNPIEAIDPQVASQNTDRAAAESEKTSQRTLEDMADDLRRYSGITDEYLQQQAIEHVKKTAVPGMDLAAQARREFYDQKDFVTQKIQHLNDEVIGAVKNGAAAFSLHPDQWQDRDNGMPWQYDSRQAQMKLIEQAKPERMAHLLTQPPPDKQSIIAGVATNPRIPPEQKAEAARSIYQGTAGQYTPEEIAAYEDLRKPVIGAHAPDREALGTLEHWAGAPNRFAATLLFGSPGQRMLKAAAEKGDVPPPNANEEPGLLGKAASAVEGAGESIRKGVDWYGQNIAKPVWDKLTWSNPEGINQTKETGGNVLASGIHRLAQGATAPTDIAAGALKVADTGRFGPVSLKTALTTGGDFDWKGAAVAAGEEPGGEHSVTQLARQSAGIFQKAAIKQAQDFDGTPEEKAAYARKLYNKYLDSNVLGPAIRNPEAAQAIAENVASPYNVINPLEEGAAVLGKAWQAVPLAVAKPVEKAVGAFGRGLSAPFRDLQPGEQAMRDLPNVGGAEGPELASAMRRQHYEASAQVGDQISDLKSTFAPMQAIRDTPEGETAFYLAHANERTQAHPLVQKAVADYQAMSEAQQAKVDAAVQAARDTEQTHQGIKEANPELFQEFNEAGDLQPGNVRPWEDYVPHRQLREGWKNEAPTVLATTGKEPPAVDPFAASSKFRSDKYPLEAWHPDLATQWDREAANLSGTMRGAQEAQGTVRRFYAQGAVQEMPAAAGEAETLKQKQFLQDVTGEKYISSDEIFRHGSSGETATDTLTRLLYKPGEVKQGEKVLLMPEKGVGEYFRGLLMAPISPEVSALKDRMFSATKALDTLADWTARPLNAIDRALRTRVVNPFNAQRNLLFAGITPFLMGGKDGIKTSAPAWGAAVAEQLLKGGERTGGLWDTLSPLAGEDGTKPLVGHVADTLDSMGLLNKSQGRFIGPQQYPGPAGWLAAKMGQVTRNVSPLGIPLGKSVSADAVNALVDNVQKIAAGMTFWQGDSPAQLDKFFALVSKNAGNYNALSALERKVSSDVISYYPWYRYVAPYVLQQVYENPQRIMPWIIGREYMQNKYGKNVPESKYAIPAYLRDIGVPSPDQFQGPEESWGHKFAVSMIEDPIGAASGFFIPAIQNLVTGRGGSSQNVLGNLSLVPRMLYELFTHRDATTGDLVESPIDYAQALGRNGNWRLTLGKGFDAAVDSLQTPIPMPSPALQATWDLFGKTRGVPLNQLDWAGRLRGGHFMGALGAIGNAIMGEERAVGTGLFSGMPQDEQKNIARAKKQALDLAEKTR